jgi:uncharacterized protein YkuJ
MDLLSTGYLILYGVILAVAGLSIIAFLYRRRKKVVMEPTKNLVKEKDVEIEIIKSNLSTIISRLEALEQKFNLLGAQTNVEKDIDFNKLLERIVLSQLKAGNVKLEVGIQDAKVKIFGAEGKYNLTLKFASEEEKPKQNFEVKEYVDSEGRKHAILWDKGERVP